MKSFFKTLFVALFAGFAGAWLFQVVGPYANAGATAATQPTPEQINAPARAPGGVAAGAVGTWANRPLNSINASTDFNQAAVVATPSVVYIKNVMENNYGRSTFLDWFFQGPSQAPTRISSGSGVIYTPNGYVVTNNHVIEDADKLEVIWNKRTFKATVVGTDPSTDLAVLKIEGQNLPAIPLGTSESVNVGQWVLAVGNPFNLTSTVTAGIVSAKGREINILKGRFPLESFIQTDAAINPGNSGGALVNLQGELVGINTAILSQTGSYAGYGFAVPVDIMRKVVDDLINYGEVQKAFFGGEVVDVNEKIAERLELNSLRGVVVSYLQTDGAAAMAGVQNGDVIIALNGQPIDARNVFEEQLSYRSPGDTIAITYQRNGQTLQSTVTLTNREGGLGILRRELVNSQTLGAELEVVSKVERDVLGIESGVRIVKVFNNGLMARMDIQEGFIITAVNRQGINQPKELSQALENARGPVVISGLDARGRRQAYRYNFY